MVPVAAEPLPLTNRQAEILSLVGQYYAVAQEGCPASLVARRLDLHHESVRRQFAELHRKGWLTTNASPATPARPFLARRPS